ncbi:hypothetical protein QJS04_geneDACA009357 [Acorus gramineus]|uniref:Uncharacterized protein n=1 Tax=Acorus gramineus TaxID=55184 RepID=A0AAV9AGG2_ACOGR|nr:hypothetical protein QJS04_geneDACA009357 [Acorus gramineus]
MDRGGGKTERITRGWGEERLRGEGERLPSVWMRVERERGKQIKNESKDKNEKKEKE